MKMQNRLRTGAPTSLLTRIVSATAGAALITSAALAGQAGAHGATADRPGTPEFPSTANHALRGVWTATVDPLATPAGDQPPFESTLAFGRAKVLNEITSRTTSTSAGLGVWESLGDSTYRTRWLKYRFDASGAYLGKTIVTEEIKVLSRSSYQGLAQTLVVAPTGAVVAQFDAEVTAERLTP